MPIPGGPDDGDERRRALAHDRVEGTAKRCELVLAPDRRHLEPPLDAERAEHVEQAPARVDGLDGDSVANELLRRVRDQDLADRGRAPEPRRDARGAADRRRRERDARDDLTGVDADADVDADAEVALEARAQRDDRLAQLDRRAHRPQRVVLVHAREAEHGDDLDLARPVDRAAVLLDDLRQLVAEVREDGLQRLRLDRVTARRREREVREEHGDRLAAGLLRRRSSLRVRAAPQARDAPTLRDRATDPG